MGLLTIEMGKIIMNLIGSDYNYQLKMSQVKTMASNLRLPLSIHSKIISFVTQTREEIES